MNNLFKTLLIFFFGLPETTEVYKDQHTPMVYDKISDSKEEAMASSETIEAIEQMMDPL